MRLKGIQWLHDLTVRTRKAEKLLIKIQCKLVGICAIW